MKTSKFFAAALVAVSVTGLSAQNLTPEIVLPSPGEKFVINKMSDNGLWGISEKASTTDGDLRPTGGRLFNLTTFEKTEITSPTGYCGVNDVTDDGKIVVGQYNMMPGYWNLETDSWTVMPMPEGFNMGCLNAVTPDGRYAVGYLSTTLDEWKAYPIMYDLTTNTQVDLPNIPYLDMQHKDQDQNAFYGVSPDGRFILGYMSQSYVLPPQLCVYVYDRQDDSVDFVGFTPDDSKPWEPDVPNTFFVEGPVMSNNGLWVTGTAYMVVQIPGSSWPSESRHPFRYDVLNKKIEILTENEAADVAGFSIGNDGFLYMATPAENPYPNAVFQQGQFLVSLEQIYRQVYNLNFEEASGFAVSGRPLSVSNDGLTMVMLPNLDETYILRLKEPIADAVSKVKLLADYTTLPTPGAQMSKLNTITLTFEREVAVKGNSSKITFKSEDGKQSWSPVSSNGFVADGKKVTITFRNRDLEAGMKYTLNIPEGMIVMKADNSIVADEINVEFNGRANTPVKMLSAVPEDGAAVSYLDLNANPIVLTFDADLKLGENVTGFLYEDGEEAPVSTMGIAAGGRQALVFPPVRQNLWKDSEYTVVIPANALTDISGGGPNEEITLHYSGNYVREVSADDKYLFNEDCGSTDNFMFYDGDNNTPDAVATDWGFTKDTPWHYTRDDDSTDMALASHSMYRPAGKSDDWLVTSQIHIPDEKCYLEFDAQSYLYATTDYLKIYVFEATEVYHSLNAEVIEKIRKEGKVVFNEQLNPGSDEEKLAGDWTRYVVRLPEYAGKFIYIAFLNEMDDQSAIFIDNVSVIHDMAFLTTIDTPARVVNQEEAVIKGRVSVASDIDSFDAISMTLLDGEGTEVSKINADGLTIDKQNPFVFTFPESLKLKKAETNRYSIQITLGSNSMSVAGEIRNLTYQPGRKIVLEEFTGQTCPNCPQGILAIENIKKLYPNALIPVGIHTYQGDNLGAGLDNYSTFLGLNAAPSGRIDRGVIAFPMRAVNGAFTFSGDGIPDPDTGEEFVLWLDLFREQYQAPTDLELSLKSQLDEANNCVNVEALVTSAINLERTSYNLFAVILENQIATAQQNNLYSTKDPLLGEWGAGGSYAAPVVVPYMADDVVRTTWGTTYNGTGGLIPSNIKAGEVYKADIKIPLSSNITKLENCDVVVMLIDAGSDRVVNANICALNGDTGLDEVVAIENGTKIGVAVVGDALMVNGENFRVEAYDLAGMPVVKAAATGLHAYSLNGYKGILLIKVADAEGNVSTQKVLVK